MNQYLQLHRKVNRQHRCYCGSEMILVGYTWVCVAEFKSTLKEKK